MDTAIEPVEGACRCGRVRMAVAAPPRLTMACHCTGCQVMSSSAFSLSAVIPAKAFSVTQGEAVVGGLQAGGGGHFFCEFCKTWMFTRPDDAPIVNVRPTLFPPSEWATPFIETFTSEKLPWATTPAVHSFDRFPAWSDFETLTTEFARRMATDLS